MRRDEKARRGWLLHHLETGNWAEAELLVVSAAEQEQLIQARETREKEAAQHAQQAQAERVLLENEAWQAAAEAEASEDAPASPKLRSGRIRPHRQATIPDSLREQVDTPNTRRGMVKVRRPLAAAHPRGHSQPCRPTRLRMAWLPSGSERSALAAWVPRRGCGDALGTCPR